MRGLSAFIHVSMDGYYADSRGDMSWAHRGGEDPEWQTFTASNATEGGELVFGRLTYDLMAGFWPTPMAAAQMPTVAEHMNRLPKVVFSRTLIDAAWQNTRLFVGGDLDELAAQVQSLKSEVGADLVVLGSGSLVTQLVAARLLDKLLLVVNPLALGSGRLLFAGLRAPAEFQLDSARAFANGKVLLSYTPQ